MDMNSKPWLEAVKRGASQSVQPLQPKQSLLPTSQSVQPLQPKQSLVPPIGGELSLQMKMVVTEAITGSFAKGMLKDSTPATMFILRKEYYEQMKAYRENGHEDRLFVYDLGFHEDPKCMVLVTESFDANLSDWLQTQNPNSGMQFNMEHVANILGCLLRTAIATRDLFGDFKFEAKNVYVSSSTGDVVCKVLNLNVPTDGDSHINCMEGLSSVVSKWLGIGTTRQSEVPGDICVLLWMMKNLKPSHFPPKSGRLDALLQSPVFHRHSKAKVLDFVIRLDWRLQDQDKFKCSRAAVAALKAWGAIGINSGSGWLNRRRLHGEVLRCVDNAPNYPGNGMECFLRGYRNIASHFNEAKYKYVLDADEVYDQLEHMLHGAWSALHYIAIEAGLLILPF